MCQPSTNKKSTGEGRGTFLAGGLMLAVCVLGPAALAAVASLGVTRFAGAVGAVLVAALIGVAVGRRSVRRGAVDDAADK